MDLVPFENIPELFFSLHDAFQVGQDLGFLGSELLLLRAIRALSQEALSVVRLHSQIGILPEQTAPALTLIGVEREVGYSEALGT